MTSPVSHTPYTGHSQDSFCEFSIRGPPFLRTLYPREPLQTLPTHPLRLRRIANDMPLLCLLPLTCAVHTQSTRAERARKFALATLAAVGIVYGFVCVCMFACECTSVSVRRSAGVKVLVEQTHVFTGIVHVHGAHIHSTPAQKLFLSAFAQGYRHFAAVHVQVCCDAPSFLAPARGAPVEKAVLCVMLFTPFSLLEVSAHNHSPCITAVGSRTN